MIRNAQLVLLLILALPRVPYAAEVVELNESNWREFAPEGKEADWIFGDVVMRSDKLTVVVAKAISGRNANMTVRHVAGSIIDMTFRYRPNDQLSCYYPAAAEYPLRDLSYLSEGAAVYVSCASEPTPDKPSVELDYRLRDGDTFVRVTTRFRNPHTNEITFPLRDSVRADRGFKHDLTDDFFVCHDLWWRQAYGLAAIEHRISAVSDTLERERPVLAYGDGDATEGADITLQPGEFYEIVRLLFVGENALDVRAGWARYQGRDLGRVDVVVKDSAGRGVPHANVQVRQAEAMVGQALGPEAGPLRLQLPPGDYRIVAEKEGYETRQRDLTVTKDRQLCIVEFPEPGFLEGSIVDAQGKPLPAKFNTEAGMSKIPILGPIRGPTK